MRWWPVGIEAASVASMATQRLLAYVGPLDADYAPLSQKRARAGCKHSRAHILIVSHSETVLYILRDFMWMNNREECYRAVAQRSTAISHLIGRGY